MMFKRMQRLKKNDKESSQRGIALFMVMSTLAILSILIAELTYSVQVNSRMAYNSVDNLKSYYMAKAGYRISLLRLKAFVQAKSYLGKQNKDVQGAVGNELLDKIWSIPFIFPIPVLPNMLEAEADPIKKFAKESSLTGSFTANITAQSSKLNLNNVFIKKITENAEKTTKTEEKTGEKKEEKSEATTRDVDFRPMIESAISNALENKKNDDRDFADTYRNVQGKDIVDALFAYLFKETPQSNLPGFKPINAKEAPFYALTEIHLIPGIDDTLYDLIDPLFTVFNTMGINVNTCGKSMFQSIYPEATPEDIAQLMRKRDDPDVGKPWSNEEEFWKSSTDTIASATVEKAKERIKNAGIKIITEEKSFKISVLANQGQSTKRLEAYIVVDPPKKSSKNSTNEKTDGSAQEERFVPVQNPSAQAQNAADAGKESARKKAGLSLIYWRVY